ncbi:MAG: hypothetical protein RLY50_1021, partial [Actinomycetota bacterium]
MVGRDSGGAHDPWHLVFVHVNRHRASLEKCRDAFDRVSHHRAADMIRVIVAHQDAGHAHAVRFGNCQEFVDCVGGVDQEAFSAV